MAESEPQRGFPRLRRAATSFPGNLHLVLVLRPSALLSSAPSPSSSTDLGFRFSRDDFLLKMPVLMLGDLLRYVDDNRPASDACGGARSDWIVLRSAIETFAVTVKEVAHLLQAFGSELSDGELPDEADAVDFLLRSHTRRYRRMKEDVVGVLTEGRLLLDNLQTLRKDAAEDRDDVRSDLETVQRLLSQLRDMEEAFDGFFEKHHLKMQQYQQLLLYERNFQEMEEELEKMSGEEKAIPAAGDTLLRTEQLIGELGALEQRAQEVTSRAQVVTLRGHQLAARHHYALALIMQRCNELRHRCDVINGGLRGKRASLTRARDLLQRLDRALRWCDEGAYLLASQMVDRFQSREGAQEALRRLLEHQERAPDSKGDVLSLELEAILAPQLQGQIAAATDKLASMRAMIRNREGCLRKMADARVRPVQPVAPRPEAEAEPARPHGAKAPLFSPKHGVDFNLLNSRFSFDLLPGKRSSRRSGDQPEIHVMHDYPGNRSSLYGPAPDSDSEAEEGAEQVTSRIMKELISTEKLYVEQLLAVLLGYRAEMEDPSARDLLPALLRGREDVLFGNMPQIYQFHSRTFLQDLQRCLDTPERVGQCFLQWKEKFQLYEHYCQNKPHSESLWNRCSDSAFFQECQRKLGHKLSLDSYLLKPVQRLAKYQLILKELLKRCDEPRDRAQLQEALDCMLDLLKSVNDSMHQIAIVGYQVAVEPTSSRGVGVKGQRNAPSGRGGRRASARLGAAKGRGRRDRRCAAARRAGAAGRAGPAGPRGSAGGLQRVEQPQEGGGGARAGDGPLQGRPAPRLPLRAGAGVLQAPRRPRPLARLQLQVLPRDEFGEPGGKRQRRRQEVRTVPRRNPGSLRPAGSQRGGEGGVAGGDPKDHRPSGPRLRPRPPRRMGGVGQRRPRPVPERPGGGRQRWLRRVRLGRRGGRGVARATGGGSLPNPGGRRLGVRRRHHLGVRRPHPAAAPRPGRKVAGAQREPRPRGARPALGPASDSGGDALSRETSQKSAAWPLPPWSRVQARHKCLGREERQGAFPTLPAFGARFESARWIRRGLAQ